MSRLRQLVAVVLCLAICLAFPAVCLHVLTMPSSLSQTCTDSMHRDLNPSMPGMLMVPIAGQSHTHPAPLPNSCCAAHPQLAAVTTAPPHLPDLQVARVPIAWHTNFAWTTATPSNTAAPSPPPLPVRTPLRI